MARPYSISADPDGRRLRITATTKGRYSGRLPELPVGTRVIPEGPCGGLVPVLRRDRPVLFVGAGIGITPLRALLARSTGNPIVVVYRVHRAHDIAFRAEPDELAEHRNAKIHYLIGSRHEPNNQLTARRLGELGPGINRAVIDVCGSGPFVRHVRAELSAFGVPSRHIHRESFDTW